MRASAKAWMAEALYSADRCIQRTAFSRSLAGGAWARTGDVAATTATKTSAARQRADARARAAAIIGFLLWRDGVSSLLGGCGATRAAGPDPGSGGRSRPRSRG